MVKRCVCFFLLIAWILLAGCQGQDVSTTSSESDERISVDFQMTDQSVINPFMGFAVDATSKKAASNYSLVYIDITFRELQPDAPDQFDFEAIAQSNHIDLWKSQGKHAVLRFVCDLPGEKKHMNIPDWLYALTADGTFYNTSYGKGYSPDYSNEVFMKYHKQAIAAVADYFSDGFVSFVELGSLGHWGEWHVKREDGIVPMPDAAVRDEYVRHYTESFQTAKLLMRRPFQSAAEHQLGLFNDMAGDPEATAEWIDWIDNGGDYTQTGEKGALCPMPDFWKTSPSGGELTSSLSMEYLCGEGLEPTLSLLKETHTTFIGPKCPVSSSDKYDDEMYQNAASEMIGAIGYRIGITRFEMKKSAKDGGYLVSMEWENNGVAPLYFDLPVKLYLTDREGNSTNIADVDIKLSELLPGEKKSTATEIRIDSKTGQKSITLGIIDPMTNKPCVKLISDQEYTEDNLAELYRFD